MLAGDWLDGAGRWTGGRTCDSRGPLASPLCSVKTLDFLLLRGASAPVCSWSADVLRMGNGSLAAMVTVSLLPLCSFSFGFFGMG